MTVEDECELEATLQRHRIGAAIFAPFAVECLRGAEQRNQIVLSVSMRNMGIVGDVQRNLRLSWTDKSVSTQPLAVQERTVTEWAACGVACAIISVYTNFQIRSVAADGDRFDYWVGNAKMNHQPHKGISRQGLNTAFELEESYKSNLLLQATLLREQGQEGAATRFAEAAAIEERLGEICVKQGLKEKSFVHRFSAASCWAQAGDFYCAIQLCDALLTDTGLPERLRRRIQDYADTLRTRRSQWYAELIETTMNNEV